MKMNIKNKEKELWVTDKSAEVVLEIESCKEVFFNITYTSLRDMLLDILESKAEIEEAILKSDRITLYIQDKDDKMKTYLAEGSDEKGIFYQIVLKMNKK